MFKIHEYVVCPGHGVGKILAIQEQNIQDQKVAFYLVKILKDNITILVPVQGKGHIRALASQVEIENVFSFLKNHNFEPDLSTWNRRQRDYLNKVKTGDLMDIADVLRSLLVIQNKKKLSFGEKKMLAQCKDLLLKEVSLVKNQSLEELDKNIENIFNG